MIQLGVPIADGGGVKSTHTDKDGNVVAVYNNGDLGVYKHDDLSKWDGVSTLSTAGEGITRMGQTAFWDEFISPESGAVFGQINFGASWDKVIDAMHQKSRSMDLIEIAQNSRPTGMFDVKYYYPNEGRLLDGRYVSSRSAGNYLAAYNAARGKLGILGVSFTGFMKLAGALHVRGPKLTETDMAHLMMSSHPGYEPPPAYGENMYCYRMCRFGWGQATFADFGWGMVMGIK